MEYRWALSEPDRFLIHHWPEDSVVFDIGSADTHSLDAAAVELMERLASGPLSRDCLVGYFGALVDHLPTGTKEEIVDRRLSQLQQIGLIRLIAVEAV